MFSFEPKVKNGDEQRFLRNRESLRTMDSNLCCECRICPILDPKLKESKIIYCFDLDIFKKKYLKDSCFECK